VCVYSVCVCLVCVCVWCVCVSGVCVCLVCVCVSGVCVSGVCVPGVCVSGVCVCVCLYICMYGYAKVDHMFTVCLLNTELVLHLRETNCCIVRFVSIARFCTLVCGAL